VRGWSSAGSGKAGAWPAASEWQAVAGRQRRKQVGLASAVRRPRWQVVRSSRQISRRATDSLQKRALRNGPARPSHVEHSSLP